MTDPGDLIKGMCLPDGRFEAQSKSDRSQQGGAPKGNNFF
jgi:hypothetical protein